MLLVFKHLNLKQYVAKHWIFVTNPNNLVICLDKCVFGVEPSKYGFTARNLLNKDDLFFFYVRSARTGASKCELGFIGPYMVVGHYVSSPNNSTVNAWKPSGKFAVIIGFKNGNHSVGFVPMDSVFYALSFITNKARTGRGAGKTTYNSQ